MKIEQKHLLLFFITLSTLVGYSFKVPAQKLTASGLTCEYKTNPIGIDNHYPRLSWIVISGERNIKQIAYRIIVSENLNIVKNEKGDLWDSD